MLAPIIQIQYNKIEQIANRFGQEAQRVQQMYQQLLTREHALQNGGWVGRGAEAFFNEMENDVLPGTQRLHHALLEAQSAILKISQILREAEEEAAHLFGRSAMGEQDSMSAHGHTEAILAESLLPLKVSVSTIFSSDYMEGMMGKSIMGADSKTLNQAMLTLLDENASPYEIEHALRDLAWARGKSLEEIRASYERFLEIKAQIEARKGDDVPWRVLPLFELFHKDFVGSTVHMRFGKVVGDALGIDPVFGALLNPTGGLVGPGEIALATPPEHPLTYHGIFHDAGGFLYNNLGIGPGYDYLGQESGRDKGSPLTGQEAGIHYWNVYWERTGRSAPLAGVAEFGGTLLGELEDFQAGLQQVGAMIGESVVQFLPSI